MLAAIALGMLWLGQTVASVIFRDPYNPESFRRWTSLTLLLYFGWHIIRVAYRRPDHAIEWSPAESALIVGGPFRRLDVLIYRFVVILTSALPKALLTGFVLLPDLWWSGLPGIVLALVFLEAFRMAIDIAVCCLSPQAYRIGRGLVFGSALVAVTGFLWQVQTAARALEFSGEAESSRWWTASTSIGASWRNSPVGTTLELPFATFADVICAQQPTVVLAVSLTFTMLMVGGLLATIVWLDCRHESLVVARQTVVREESQSDEQHAQHDTGPIPLPQIPRLAAVGPIVWRQLKSAGRYRGSLVVALAIPGVLSCLPLVSVADATYAFLALVAAVVFYSFVLLPEAIKFDFRLDSDHLTQLKVLPISPLRMVIGQLAVPVLVATLFQITLYLLAGLSRPVSPQLVVTAILLSVPINVLFVATDNLIFLLYPHRPTQEGFEAFVRTILKFTFKSVLLALAGAFVGFWAVSSRHLVDTMGGVTEQTRLLFISGLCLGAWVSAAISLLAVTRAFERFDVSVSVPA